MFKKGDIVEVMGHCFGGYRFSDNSKRSIFEIDYNEKHFKRGIVLGFSFIRTGQYNSGSGDVYDYQPGFLTSIKDNKIWRVEILEAGNRYLEPLRCFEHQIREIK